MLIFDTQRLQPSTKQVEIVISIETIDQLHKYLMRWKTNTTIHKYIIQYLPTYNNYFLLVRIRASSVNFFCKKPARFLNKNPIPEA